MPPFTAIDFVVRSVGRECLAPAGSSASHNGGSAIFDGAGASPLKPSNIGTELDRRIDAALKATADSIGPLSVAVNRLNRVHITLKEQLASGLLTDAEYAKEAGGLLNILSNFDGLI